MSALEQSNLIRPPVTAQPPRDVATTDLPRERDYSGYVARFVLLALAFGLAYGLSRFAGGRPYFGLLSLSGVILVCIGLVLGPRMHVRSARVAVPLFDLAWLSFAMYLTTGPASTVLPLLYIVVAMASMRGNRWEIGTCIAGAITAIFALAQSHQTGPAMNLAVAQATLLAAGALAIRLTVTETVPLEVCEDNSALYETLLEKTSDAVFALAPDSWAVLHANPAARLLCGETPEAPVGHRPLDGLIHFTDNKFLSTCRQALMAGDAVTDAVTYAHGRDDQRLMLRCYMTSVQPLGQRPFVQAIFDVVQEPQLVTAVPTPVRDDFTLNYIPSLTHELNNQLAAIRLSAELAAATGRMPDFGEIQQQVDRCQDVLQTVVLQILRSSTPTPVGGQTPQTDLHLALERVLLLTRPQVLTNGVQLQVDIPGQLPTVAGFAHELQEALIRIIIHSVKSMADRDSARMMELTVAARPRGVEVVLADAGPGLGAREVALISGRSVAVSRAEDRTWEIIRDAICRFGGEVQAGNGLNGGMRVRVFLPAYVEQQGVA